MIHFTRKVKNIFKDDFDIDFEIMRLHGVFEMDFDIDDFQDFQHSFIELSQVS